MYCIRSYGKIICFYVAVRNFSNTDAGKLFHTICRYALGENIDDIEEKIKVAFNFFKVRLDKNRKNWGKTRIARKESGRLGGLAKQANAKFAKQNKQTVANLPVNVSDSVSDSVSVNDINDSVSVNDIKKKASPSEEVITILEDLNKRIKSKKGFSPLAQSNQNLIKARMSEGFTVENFITVNDFHADNCLRAMVKVIWPMEARGLSCCCMKASSFPESPKVFIY